MQEAALTALDSEQWEHLLNDEAVTPESVWRILLCIYTSLNSEACASDIAARLSTHHTCINRIVGTYGKRVVTTTGVQPELRSDGSARWWKVLFVGRDDHGRFYWSMRSQLLHAFRKLYNPIDTQLPHTANDLQNYFQEGQVQKCPVNRYTRNRQARQMCIEYYGPICAVCGFDFERVYGSIGKDKIHVHHLQPVAEAQYPHVVDPIKDLRPVCPNCHLVIHSTEIPLTIDQLRDIIHSRNPDKHERHRINILQQRCCMRNNGTEILQ